MTDLLTDAPEPTPADLIRDAIDLMRATWRVRGDFIIGRLTTGHGFCPVGAMSALAGDVFVSGVPQCRVPIVRATMAWLVEFYRLPRSRPEVKAGRDNSRMAYARVAEWADTFPESADEDLYAALEAAAAAWRPSSNPNRTTSRRRRS